MCSCRSDEDASGAERTLAPWVIAATSNAVDMASKHSHERFDRQTRGASCRGPFNASFRRLCSLRNFLCAEIHLSSLPSLES